MTDRAGEPAQTDLFSLGDHRNILDPKWRAILCEDHTLFNVLDISHQSHDADIDLLKSSFDEAATRVGVVVGELLFDLVDAQSVGDQFVRVNPDLILSGRSAKACDVNNIWDCLEILLHY